MKFIALCTIDGVGFACTRYLGIKRALVAKKLPKLPLLTDHGECSAAHGLPLEDERELHITGGSKFERWDNTTTKTWRLSNGQHVQRKLLRQITKRLKGEVRICGGAAPEYWDPLLVREDGELVALLMPVCHPEQERGEGA